MDVAFKLNHKKKATEAQNKKLKTMKDEIEKLKKEKIIKN